MYAAGFQVVKWKHLNQGGTSLVCAPGVVDGTFAIVTSLTPWGHGSYGPIPASAILSVRDVDFSDSFPYPGSGGRRRWTWQEFVSHIRECAAWKPFQWSMVIARLDAMTMPQSQEFPLFTSEPIDASCLAKPLGLDAPTIRRDGNCWLIEDEGLLRLIIQPIEGDGFAEIGTSLTSPEICLIQDVDEALRTICSKVTALSNKGWM